jgi:transcriptional regulator with XRE-family HTH domain
LCLPLLTTKAILASMFTNVNNGANKMTIEEIKRRLSDRNLAEVARRIGVTRAYLSYIVTGNRTPNAEMLAKIEGYLNANP